jgi:5,6-dimethylbenzimidazole synthase
MPTTFPFVPPLDPTTGAPTDATALDELLTRLLVWRRDVRRFTAAPVDPALLERLLDLACLAPSVGNSQPWRFVRVRDPARRARVVELFERENAAAAAARPESDRDAYRALKLAALDSAPEHLAVFCDVDPEQGRGLGRRTMPETVAYSAVCAVHTLWLAARAHGLGLGWVSILAPDELNELLDVPAAWRFIAYLCLGVPVETSAEPELSRLGWQAREPACREVLER